MIPIKWHKLFAGFAAVLFSVMTVSANDAEVITEPEHILPHPELMENYTFPENWSEDALRFCVANEMMQGWQGKLWENQNATRAETVAMLVRLMALEKTEDISRFNDVSSSDWFYQEIAKAVSAGIIRGTTETRLSPDNYVTREQAAAMISRGFGLNAVDPDLWKSFRDSYEISDYARYSVSALAERELLRGYPDGSLRPGSFITRAELAQIFYNLFTCVIQEPTFPDTGRALAPAGSSAGSPVFYHGDLTVVGEQILCDQWNIEGELRVSGGAAEFNQCSAELVSASAGANLSGDLHTDRLLLAGGDSETSLSAPEVSVYGDCTLNGTYQKIYCYGNETSVTLNGTADVVEIFGNKSSLSGSGSAESVKLYGKDAQLTLQTGEIQDLYPQMLEDALNSVETLTVWDEVLYDTGLYSDGDYYGVYGCIGELPAGTKLEHFYYHEGSYSVGVYDKNGILRYIPYENVQIPSEAEIAPEPYDPWVAEAFVNRSGHSSNTDYLIWVSLKTQTVDVFSGSAGNWHLRGRYPCSSGKPETPTITGIFQLEYKDSVWDFGSYRVYYASGFSGGYAFHSITYAPYSDDVIDGTLGYPASHGCVRMRLEDCEYIFENLPLGTAVLVY